MRNLIALLVVATAILAGPCLSGDLPDAPIASAEQAMDVAIARQMEEAGIVGVGAAIIVRGKLVWAKGYGFADKQRNVPFTKDTVLNIGSISKTFTGAAMMRATQDGLLDLDNDINAYLPFSVRNPRFPKSKITLSQLATHTSGITDRWPVYSATYHYGDSVPEPLGQFLKGYFVAGGADYSEDNFIDAAPGTRREYSNIGAGLAGYIVERVTGQPLDAYTRRHIFAPLGMRNTAWSISGIDPALRATLYVSQDGWPIPIQPYSGTTYPDGGVRTSVADLSRFFIALIGDGSFDGARILDKRTVEEMTRFQWTSRHKPDNVELTQKNSGLFWSSKYNVTRIGHGGTDPGVATEMLADPSKEIGVILFANTSVPEKSMRPYSTIFEELWKYAETRKLSGTDQSNVALNSLTVKTNSIPTKLMLIKEQFISDPALISCRKAGRSGCWIESP